jgi:competence protein ComEA
VSRALLLATSMLCASTALAQPGVHRRPPPAPKVVGVVNLNTATVKQLTLLPGVGPARAKAIVAYREQQHFGRVEDVRKVKGIGKGVMKKIENHIAIAGPNTLARADANLPLTPH